MVRPDWRLPLCTGVLKSIQSPWRLGTADNPGGARLGKGRLLLPLGTERERGHVALGWETCGSEFKEGELVVS